MESFASAPVISTSPKSDQLSAFEVHGVKAKNRKNATHRERVTIAAFTNMTVRIRLRYSVAKDTGNPYLVSRIRAFVIWNSSD